jgi:NAD(P)-dependent dehydrogenase (short-subunit alcohol dehydrogenase family)
LPPSAGRGLGFNMAQALAEVGVRGIAILDIQQDIGDKAARDMTQETGIDTSFHRVDVRDVDAVGQTIGKIAEHYGGIDILINAAGIAE